MGIFMGKLLLVYREGNLLQKKNPPIFAPLRGGPGEPEILGRPNDSLYVDVEPKIRGKKPFKK